jgi:dTDP-D-glucose 4,6-dehydratase
MSYVTDRPGHDYRCAINAGKLAGELGKRSVNFIAGSAKPYAGTLSRKTGDAI